MKYCSKCGAQNEDSNAFCMQCGETLASDGAETAAQGQPDLNVQQPFQTMNTGSAAAPARPGDGLRYIKQIATSNLFLTAVILFSASVIFSFWSSVTVSSSLMNSYLEDILRSSDYYSDYFSSYMGSLLTAGTSAGSAFVSAIPGIVNVIGLWLIYSSARDVNVPGPKTAGFTVLKVMTIISLVAMCVIFGLLDVLILIVMFAFAGSGGVGFVVGMLFVLMIVTAILILVIFYYRKILAVIASAVSVIQVGYMVEKPSMYLIVWNFIFAFFGIFSLFTGFLGFIAAGTNIAFLIIISMILLNVKKDVENAEAGF